MANLKDLLVNGVTRFIGKVYAPTPEAGDNSTQVATTAFVMENAGASDYHPTLFDFKYSDKLINDIQWLRSDTFSWQDGSVYVAAYAKLLEEYNNSASTTVTEGSITFKRTPNGYKIALADQENAILNKYNSNGIAWYYILDPTNQRFKLPRTKFGFEGLRTSVGDDIEAGLPNITGSFGSGTLTKKADTTNNSTEMLATSGAILAWSSSNGSYINAASDTSWFANGSLRLDASASNPIYGNSDTVQLPATQMYLYFYVGEYTESAEAQTAGLNAELFNNKLDLNANNLDNNGKSLISGLGMPSSKYIDLTLGASESEYIAPANGYFSVGGNFDNVNGYFTFALWDNATGHTLVSSETKANSGSYSCYCWVPVKKGDKVIAYYNYSPFSSTTSGTPFFIFVYAEGEAPSGGTTSGGTTSGGPPSGGPALGGTYN